MKKNSGFTLLELLITGAVISIVMAIAIPSMTTFTQNDRLTTNINSLIGSLSYARSEAVKRSQQVAVCVSSDTASCTGGSWEDGWIVYIDADGSSTFSAGEEILRAQQTLDGSNTFTSTIGTQVTYDYRGFVDAASVGSFQLCDARTGPFGKTVRVSTTGRVRFEDDAAC
ncbi:MAG: prepilin-type N-terminal cleavage/methylation domain-containing protein [Gammaproteobacteria bacterium]|nr:prepilin-type N-terminal cleavage/methylation domain-containing protein [Gammaproteobacteria bacterium]